MSEDNRRVICVGFKCRSCGEEYEIIPQVGDDLMGFVEKYIDARQYYYGPPLTCAHKCAITDDTVVRLSVADMEYVESRPVNWVPTEFVVKTTNTQKDGE